MPPPVRPPVLPVPIDDGSVDVPAWLQPRLGARVTAAQLASVPEAQQFGVMDDFAAVRPHDERVFQVDVSRMRPHTDAEFAQMDREWQRTRARVIAAGGDINGPPPRGGWDQWLGNAEAPVSTAPMPAARGGVERSAVGQIFNTAADAVAPMSDPQRSPGSILGRGSQPGLVRVLDASGTEREIPATVLSRLGMRADLAAGDAAVEAMQPAPAPRIAQAPVVDIGEVSVTPRQTAQDAMAEAQFRGAQDIGGAVLDATTGGAFTQATRAQAAAAGAAGAATDASNAATAEATREAQGAADETGADVAAQQQARAAEYGGLESRAMRGDQQAVYDLFRAAQGGDVQAAEALDRARAFQQPTGGGGGTRVRQTETTRFSGPGRAPTPEEAAELQRAAAEQDRAEREQMLALGAEAEAEAGALADTAEAMTRAQAELDSIERRRLEAERARQVEVQRRQRALDAEAARVGSMELDPQRMFAKGETRNRFSAAISIMLGGLADAVRGGDAGLNTALSIINTSIDRDIEAQRGNVSIAQQGLQAKRGLLDDMRAQFGDQQAAEAAARAIMLDGVERQIAALQTSATSDAQRQALQRLTAEIQGQRAAARQQAIIGGLGTSELVIEQSRGTGGGGGRRVVIPDTPEAGATTAERGALAAQELAIEETTRKLDRMAELLEEGALVGPVASRVPFRTTISRNAREFDRLSTQLTMQMREDVLGPGTVTQAERQMLFDAVGLTSNLPADEVAKVVRDMRDSLVRRRAFARRAVGGGAVVEAERRDPAEREAARRGGASVESIPGARRAP